jgi:hypothetical protein
MEGDMTKVTRCAAVVSLATLALVLAGPLAAEDGAASVEELVEKCKGIEDMASLVPLVHPDDRPMLGFGMLMMGTMAPMMALPDVISGDNEAEAGARADELIAEFEALESKHGLRQPPDDLPSAETAEGMTERARYIFEGVDVAAFVGDVEAWLEASLGEEAMQGGFKRDFDAIENLRVEGDSATATVDGEPIEFERVDGRWYVRVDL